ncbi:MULTISPECIES: hypothetical protein [unclassified Bradyrhizobium]|uniref:hypothetical protein n=1 Tax=unclassified Bradyrhizobium TaxID=2631580 RepID=UPI001FF7B2BA|nr:MULTISPECIES: hypothetical protein [unclassified Bradyrhizobium]MCK1508701.1 hypothetical protein [Bradyrhizobium sp. 18]MCK1673849.1 hypothetical protein [Bradyrhizobium sp. 150]
MSKSCYFFHLVKQLHVEKGGTVQVGRTFVGHSLATWAHHNAVDQVAEGDTSFGRFRIDLQRRDEFLCLRAEDLAKLRVVERDYILADAA